MNKEGNTYTFIFSIGMVVVVATVLAYLAGALSPLQVKNVRDDKMIQILSSVGVEANSNDAQNLFDKYIGDNLVAVNPAGDVVSEDRDKIFAIQLEKELKKPQEEKELPVFICKLDDGSTKYILSLRGKGLWGPIWGYMALEPDKNTIFGATFDHKGETPGLGAEISSTAYENHFKGKTIFEGDKLIGIVIEKGGASSPDTHSVDAVSGGTITSKGLEKMIKDCLIDYENYLKK